MSNDNNSGSGGVGFFGLLTLMLIGLKLTGVIGLSWWWVFVVWLIPLLIWLLILFVLLTIKAFVQ